MDKDTQLLIGLAVVLLLVTRSKAAAAAPVQTEAPPPAPKPPAGYFEFFSDLADGVVKLLPLLGEADDYEGLSSHD